MRNRELVLANISEAREELESLEKELSNPEYDEVELQIALEHAYHHLNYAWNIRNEPFKRVAECKPEDFARWSKFPIGEINEYE